MAATVWLTSPLPGTATVRLDDDGTICVVTAATENGSGAVSMGVTQIVAEEIGIDPEDVSGHDAGHVHAPAMTLAPRDRGRRTSSGARPGPPRPRSGSASSKQPRSDGGSVADLEIVDGDVGVRGAPVSRVSLATVA